MHLFLGTVCHSSSGRDGLSIEIIHTIFLLPKYNILFIKNKKISLVYE